LGARGGGGRGCGRWPDRGHHGGRRAEEASSNNPPAPGPSRSHNPRQRIFRIGRVLRSIEFSSSIRSLVTPVPLWLRRFTLGLLAVTGALSVGCVGNHALMRRDVPHCNGLSWFGPVSESDRRRLDRWASGVG